MAALICFFRGASGQHHERSGKRNCYSIVLRSLLADMEKLRIGLLRVAAIRYGASAFRPDNEILKRPRSTYSRAGRESLPALIEVAITVTGPASQPSSGALHARSTASSAPVSNKSAYRSPDKPYRFAAECERPRLTPVTAAKENIVEKTKQVLNPCHKKAPLSKRRGCR